MPNYRCTEIYNIIQQDSDDFVYVGHTTNWKERKKAHGKCAVHGHGKEHQKLYSHIRDNGGWSNFRMIKIEDFPCDTKRDAEAREQYWIDWFRETKSCMNDHNAHGPNLERYKLKDQEYNEANKEHIAERNKKYREANKEHIAERNKKWREANKEYIAEKNKKWNEANKEHRAEYSARNRERDRLMEAKRREANRDAVNAYARLKFDCLCGGKYTHASISIHKKTKKHQDWACHASAEF